MKANPCSPHCVVRPTEDEISSINVADIMAQADALDGRCAHCLKMMLATVTLALRRCAGDSAAVEALDLLATTCREQRRMSTN